MAHDARAIANALIERAKAAGRPLTPMQIIKLVYICHGWMLGLYSRPLIREAVAAWRYGPVIPTLYHSLKHYGSEHVTEPIGRQVADLDELEADLIDQVFAKYAGLSGIALSHLTHAPNTPWSIVWHDSGQNAPISNDLIEYHYGGKASARPAAG
jgi:uncharacterized phage-associated protein